MKKPATDKRKEASMKKRAALLLITVIAAVSSSLGEDFKGKIAKIMARPSATAGKTIITIYFKYPLEYRRPEAAFDCIENPGHSVQISDNNANMPLSTVNQILSLALSAYNTGSSFAVDVDGNNTGGPCGNAVWGYILD
jgi:pyrroline-5-carboxylate reductase